VKQLKQQTSNLMRFRSSNAGLLVILLALLVPLGPLWYTDTSYRPAIALGVVGACVGGLAFVYINSTELNKITGQFVFRRTSLVGARTVSFPLSEITRVNIKTRTFGGGRRMSPYGFQITLMKASGEEVKLTGWRSSLDLQQRAFAVADFLGVPLGTVS